MLSEADVQAEFAHMCKPNAVVSERTSAGFADPNATHVAALQAAVGTAEACKAETTTAVVYTGNRLLDQFEPWYFAFAFAFLFPYGSGMPDPPSWSPKLRHRRPPDALRVEFSTWMRCMARRCESQINRDWTFGFTTWNLYFRSAINLSRNLSPYNAPIFDEVEQKFRALRAEEVEAGALQLLNALSGTYADVRGNLRPVNGDISKLSYVRNLRPAARKLLKNMKQTARSLPGTQEARRQMRFEIEAMRVRYGVPLFITVSPDEAHQWLFIRMSRTRASDPVRSASVWQEWCSGDRQFPSLDGDLCFPIHLENFCRALPSWQQRRAVLARDPLASVDGFHVLLRLLCRHIFGVRMCELCPDCDMTATPCSDTSGSNASLLGGAFGRVDAIYVTIEAQKSTGSLHGHIQCFVQCLHQHTPLTEIFQLPHWRLEALRQEYCKYQAHVAHAVYSGQGKDSIREGIEGAESTWPEHAEDAHMTTIPGYQQRRAQGARDLTEAEQWGQDYLEHDVVKLQYLKQHHYHPLNVETGERMPLRGCQKKENMGVCKSDFPRDQWLADRAKVLCPCQLQSHGFSLTGRKNRLGALHGPYGHPYLNPCHPALLAGMRGGNNDVQVPYRLPYACATCGDSLSGKEKQLIALAAQRAQDAQTGYCSDYCSKNQPMGFHEIKEFQKGHIALHASLKQADVEHIGKRHANRFLSDAYCKGLVRGQVECCNLRANHIDGSIVAAERVSSCNFTVFPGHVYLQLLERLDGKEAGTNIAYVRTRKAPGSGAQHVREAVTGQAYSHRPSDSECWWLSPYEFTMHWELVPARIPHSRAEWEAASPDAWDVALTPVGEQKLLQSPLHTAAKLKPSTDYRLKVLRSCDRVYFASAAATAVLRHNWYLQRRVRPRCPHFANAPVPQRWADAADRNARLTCLYFRAWTLDLTRATSQVPHLSQLLGSNETWEDALREWLLRLPCAETKRHVGNFLSVYRVRPSAEADANSDDDGVDEPFTLCPADVAAALRTQFPAQKASSSKAANDDRAIRSESAMNTADQLWQAPARPQRSSGDSGASTPYSALDLKAMQQAARKRFNAGPAVASPEPSSVTVHPCQASAAAVRTWAAALSHAPCNPEQRAFCELVAARVETELAAGASATGSGLVASEPLRWVLHGGPGTGKSHTLKFLRQDLFENVLGWHHGVDFQIVSFQAVMAELLDGDTIHHALGLDWSGDRTQSLARSMECAGRSLQWRWLILDEFSMVSAELLAQLELRCRELMRDLSLAKYDGNGKIRPFGGLNVILAGDVYQLPPPKGTFLADIPWDLLAGRKSTRQAPGHHGQTLLWGEAAAGLQGVTELVRCERTQDAWLAEVQTQLRHGDLSDNNHRFLHGRPTTVPGSWIAGQATCQQPSCAALPTQGLIPEAIQEAECSYCAADRRSRILVAQGAADTRFQKEFADAVAIFGTNDIKYHVNKLRAIQWANARDKQPYLFVAQDVASSVVVQEKPNLTTEKLQWLQRHDKECGGLYGVLPLCVGMPVRATDHLDRKRGILKGTKGYVVGWSTIANETPAPEGVVCNTLPAVVYVRFETATSWHVPGLPDANVYPVGTCRRVWYLDRQRQRPKLRASRTQFPLAPQFAITAHVAQGQTIKEGVMTDLCIGPTGNPFTVYVAITRVTGREKLLIFRPFDAAPFQKGIGLGRDLLLRHLRGDFINWQSLLAKYCEERRCATCTERKPAAAFTTGQWKREDKDRVCRECTKHYADAGTPWQCNVCKLWHAEDNFPAKHRQRQCSFFRVCLTCEVKKPCFKCGVVKAESDFGAAAWKARHADRRCCRECATKVRGCWQCRQCAERKPRTEFTAWQQGREYTQDGTQVCNACTAFAFVCRLAHRTNQRLARLRQRETRHRHAAILEDVRKEIQEIHEARQTSTRRAEAPKTDTAHASNQQLAVGPDTVTPQLYTYICPHCAKSVQSKVATGQIDHRRGDGCGHKFRVANGLLAGRTHTHTCPTCSAVVHSTKASGRIQVTPPRPNSMKDALPTESSVPPTTGTCIVDGTLRATAPTA